MIVTFNLISILNITIDVIIGLILCLSFEFSHLRERSINYQPLKGVFNINSVVKT